MTDRELLELAAKAAGLKWIEHYSGCLMMCECEDMPRYAPTAVNGAYQGWLWRPLTDDGDALRLAVKLELDMGNGVNPLDENVIMVSHAEKFGGWFEEPRGNDPYAATRRAIVRAAAEIGKDKT